MKTLLNRQVPVVWLLIVMIAVAATGIVWWVAVMGGAPSGAILIKSISQASPTPAAMAAVQRPEEAPNSTTTAIAVASIPANQAELSTPTPQMVGVYISGAVATPGLYILPAGSRVQDLVVAAGGATGDADMEQVNVAAHIADEEHVTIPHKGEAQAAPLTPQLVLHATPSKAGLKATVAPPKATGKVNINSASAQEMEALPGIGAVIAARIVAYRETNGPFTAVDDLEKVSGIGKAILAKLRDAVTVGP